MSAICGWMGPAPVSRPDTIDRQIAALFPSRGDPHREQAARTVAAAIGNNAQIAQRDGVVVACCGHPCMAANPEQTVSATTLIPLYRQYGTDLPRRLGGSFAIAVCDESRSRTLLATDRLGRQPLAWAITADHCVVFGSTATAVRAHPDIDAEVDAQAILSFLYFHVIPSPDTAFTGIGKLEPGQQLVVTPSDRRITRHWQPVFSGDASAGTESLAAEVRAIVRDAVDRHASSASTGAFLSGGIDSSTVSGMLRSIRGEPVKCFTIGFDSEGYDELGFARIATEHFDNELIHYYVTPDDVVSSLSEIAAAYDEPFGNASAIPALMCARLARQNGIDLLLAGDGGDELFAGNERYRKQLAFNWYHALPAPLRALTDRVANASPGPSARGLQRVAFYLDKARASLPRRLDLANFVTTTGASRIFTDRFLEDVDVNRPASDLAQWYAAAPACTPLANMLYLDWKLTLADNDLRKVSRMCELARIDVRYPLIDDRLIDFATTLPDDTMMPSLKLRHFFKESMRGFLPDDVIDKSKHGFGLPFGQWLREHQPLQSAVQTSLESLRDRRIVQSSFIDWVRDAHREEHASYYGSQVWVLMMLELWLAHHAPETRW